jgi:transcriptional regulator with XRE-family HTH domain
MGAEVVAVSLLRWAIGTVLRRVRQRQGLTLRDLAAASGVSVPYLSEVERGRKEASSEVLSSICRALGLALVDLLEEVRAELLRVEPAPVRLPRGGRTPQARLLTGRCASAVGRSALGRIAGGRPPGPRTLVACRRPRPRTTSSSSIGS